MATTNRERIGKGTEVAIHFLARKENWLANNDPLEKDGEPAAAALINKLGGPDETARDLAYRLYSMCECKRAEEAMAYNGLVIAWPELTKLARSQGPRTR